MIRFHEHIIVRIIGFNQAELFLGFASDPPTKLRLAPQSPNQSLSLLANNTKPFANYAT